MSPELRAVTALLRCMERRDYAGAARMLPDKAVRDGLSDLIAASSLRVERQKAIERYTREAVALIAEALAESECDGTWSCVHCGAAEAARSSGWPSARTEAA